MKITEIKFTIEKYRDVYELGRYLSEIKGKAMKHHCKCTITMLATHTTYVVKPDTHVPVVLAEMCVDMAIPHKLDNWFYHV